MTLRGFNGRTWRQHYLLHGFKSVEPYAYIQDRDVAAKHRTWPHRLTRFSSGF